MLCDVRAGTALDRPSGRFWGAGTPFLSSSPASSLPLTPQQHRGLRTVKFVLGLEAESHTRDTHFLGVTISIGNSWGPYKQTNKQKEYEVLHAQICLPETEVQTKTSK